MGFPYSLYGSVCFACDFVKDVEHRIQGSQIRTELGRVSYVAHSLHMFMDEFALNIARQIVNDASE